MPAAAVALTAILQPRGTGAPLPAVGESLSLIHEWIVFVYCCKLKINFLKLHLLLRNDPERLVKGNRLNGQNLSQFIWSFTLCRDRSGPQSQCTWNHRLWWADQLFGQKSGKRRLGSRRPRKEACAQASETGWAVWASLYCVLTTLSPSFMSFYSLRLPGHLVLQNQCGINMFLHTHVFCSNLAIDPDCIKFSSCFSLSFISNKPQRGDTVHTSYCVSPRTWYDCPLLLRLRWFKCHPSIKKKSPINLSSNSFNICYLVISCKMVMFQF